MNKFSFYLFLPLSVIYKIYFFIVFALTLIVLYPVFRYFLSSADRYPIAFRWMRFYAYLLNGLTGIFVVAKGKENIPPLGSYIICSNHTSFLDIMALYIVFKRYFIFTGKQEISKWPLFNIFYTSGMNILVDRQNREGSFKAFKQISKVIDAGNPVFIFPEGTISKKAPVLSEFKSGAFSIAIQKQVPVLPVTMINNWKLLQRGNIFHTKGHPGISRVVVHPPILTKGLKKEDLQKVEDLVKERIKGPLVEVYGAIIR